jgi:hypothetical protein
MLNIDGYQRIMAEWARKTITPHVGDIKAGKGTDVTLQDQKAFNIIFVGFTEITDTFDALEFSSVLLSVASPRSKKVSKEKYLKFVVNTYLQDVYILKERLKTYATQIKRMHDKMGRTDLTQKHIDPLFETVIGAFKGLVDTRSGHVHGKRYTDESLSDASSMALIAEHYPEFDSHYNFSLTNAKREWKNRMENNNKETAKLLNKYFNELLKVVVDSGSVITP